MPRLSLDDSVHKLLLVLVECGQLNFAIAGKCSCSRPSNFAIAEAFTLIQNILKPDVSVQEVLDIIFADAENEAGTVDTVYIAPPDPSVLTYEDSGGEDTDDDAIEYFVQQSNKYALFKNCEHPNITKNEIRCFIGILILRGYNSVPNKINYWENHKDARNECAMQ
ncbi:hypothetical protein PR048_028027 [Dryococelus australis]|uniref:PiggyBac transposable element-derived protein domain-containing protein n=1 Tax=Dryococelus australis TaxID=614101 RepID=A0ABQ9GI49_9NEOP|nr:hypothetical protein PR048_028027 [Dryococelus australis]